MTWAGGNGLQVINSDFTYAGMGRIGITPGSGLDIEYEVSTVGNSDGYFYNCNFKYNMNWQMTCNAVQNGTDLWSRHTIFEKSIFVPSGQLGINALPNARNFKFDHCTLIGQLQWAYHSIQTPFPIPYPLSMPTLLNLNTNTKFVNKTLFDEEFQEPGGIKYYFAPQADETCPTCLNCPITGAHQSLLNLDNTMGVLFEDCDIKSFLALKWINLSVAGWIQGNPPPVASWNTIRKCRFDNKGLNACNCDVHIAFFRCTKFERLNNIANSSEGMDGLNNQPATGCGINRNDVDYSTLTIGAGLNWWGQTGANANVFPSHPWQAFPQTFSPKYTDVFPSNRVTVWNDCPNCTSSVTIPGSSSCVATLPRIANNKVEKIIEELTVKPNPSTGIIYITGITSSEIKIINALGLIIRTIKSNNTELSIDVSSLSNGMYLIRTENSNAVKFIKQ